MRIASFNVKNLFLRAKALNQDTWAEGRPALERYAKVNALLNSVTYSDADKTEIAKLLTELELDKSDQGSGFVRLRQNRGSLLKRTAAGIDIVARAGTYGRQGAKGEVRAASDHAAIYADVNCERPIVKGVRE